MANPKKAPVIDGFSSIQAVRRSGRQTEVRAGPGSTSLPARAGGAPAEGVARPEAARIGRTAMPTRHEIVCYACGYEFTITGRIQNSFCPKCHEDLDTGDHVIADAFTGQLRTIGSVEIARGGRLEDAEVVTGRLTVAGKVVRSTIRVTGTVELCRGADIELPEVALRDIVVHEGAKCSYTKALACRNLTVGGELRASIAVAGVARVLPGGFLKGEIRGKHLIVEDGGGLKARVAVTGE